MINFTSTNRWSWSMMIAQKHLNGVRLHFTRKLPWIISFLGASVFESMIHWCIRLVVSWQPACLKSDGILTILTRVFKILTYMDELFADFSLEVIEMDEWCMERQLLQLMNRDNGMRTMSNHLTVEAKSLACLLSKMLPIFSKPMFQSQYFKGSDSTLKKPGLVGQNQWLLRSKRFHRGDFPPGGL